eukprot:11200661-Lingulodinium_polyedra.AAC.1
MRQLAVWAPPPRGPNGEHRSGVDPHKPHLLHDRLAKQRLQCFAFNMLACHNQTAVVVVALVVVEIVADQANDAVRGADAHADSPEIRALQ